jgi:alkylation response protein AidB-like acyl-CoA dehydrogenase
VQFAFSAEEQLLCDTARSFARERFGPAAARAALAGTWDLPGVWKEMADLGWLGVLVPEEHGGIGGSLVDAVILIEELNRALAPVPYAGNAVLVAAALRLFAPPDAAALQGELAAGARSCLVLSESLEWPVRSARGVAWQWTPDSSALVADGVSFERIEAGRVSPLASQDLLHRCASVQGIAPAHAGAEDSERAQRFVAHAQVASAAALVGAMAGALDLSVAHASQREQFGQKIGAFQAVRHLCSDMLVDLEASRSALYGAAWAVDHLEARAGARMAAIAKAWCAASARRVCENAVQVHGGIGCTWESDLHLYVRLAHVEAQALGGRNAALDTVADCGQDAESEEAHGSRG